MRSSIIYALHKILVIKSRIRRWRDMLNTRMWLKMPTKFASVNQKGKRNMSYVG
jgi:hypothetical protein